MMNFDVIIVGAGPAGLECARQLSFSKQRVLLVSKGVPCVKSCAEGLTGKDLNVLPGRIKKRGFSKLLVSGKGWRQTVDFRKDIMWTVSREELGRLYLRKLGRNIRYLDAEVQSVETKTIKTDKGTFGFGKLVGADGSLSIVRRHLNLPVGRPLVTLHCQVPGDFKDVEIHFDTGLSYTWIFPNAGYASVGTGWVADKGNSSRRRKRFFEWLGKKGIDPDGIKLEGALINYEYMGYRFGNFYLAGDAAGLASGLTGEGIYGAIASGRQIAADILGKKENVLDEYLRKKSIQDRLFKVWMNTGLARPLFELICIRLARTAWGQRKVEFLLCRP
jgi:flavin-dependent dehydrogenase